MSAAKLTAVAGVLWGLAVGILLQTNVNIEDYMGRLYLGYQKLEMLLSMEGVYAVVYLPIAYGITGFVSAYIGALIYNFVADKIGGIKVDLK